MISVRVHSFVFLLFYVILILKTKHVKLKIMSISTKATSVQTMLNSYYYSSLDDDFSNSSIKYTPNEEKLLKFLFKDYNPNIMPKEFSNETLTLYIGLAMAQLINIVREITFLFPL
jgi:hypothetical protein